MRLLVDVRALTEGVDVVIIGLAILVLMLVGKFLAAGVAQLWFKYSSEQRNTMFGLTMGQAAASLAIVIIGADVGLFDQELVTAVVLMILGAAVLSPLVVDIAGDRLRQQLADDSDGDDPWTREQRVMIPVLRESQYYKQLHDLGLILHDQDYGTPLYTLSVVNPERPFLLETEAKVEDTEELLDDAQYYSSGAGVRVDRQTRVGESTAHEIARAAIENRISTIVLGWDGARSRRQSMLGNIIDDTLRHTTQLVVVAHIREGLAATEEIVLILPRNSVYNRGFDDALDDVNILAKNIGASVRGIVVGEETDRFESKFKRAGHDMSYTLERPRDWGVEPATGGLFGSPDDWDALLELLRDEVEPTQLVILLSPRENTPGWHSQLRTLPKSISTLTDGNFLIVYPPTSDGPNIHQILSYE